MHQQGKSHQWMHAKCLQLHTHAPNDLGVEITDTDECLIKKNNTPLLGKLLQYLLTIHFQQYIYVVLWFTLYTKDLV
jgi:hypothetical protein